MINYNTMLKFINKTYLCLNMRSNYSRVIEDNYLLKCQTIKHFVNYTRTIIYIYIKNVNIYLVNLKNNV